MHLCAKFFVCCTSVTNCVMSNRGDLIEAYKILHASYRGNSLKIVNRRCHYDLRKFFFCNESPMYGTDSPRSLSQHIHLIHLKTKLINTGTCRNLDLIVK